MVLAVLARLTDPGVRAEYRFPLLAPLAVFAAVSLLSALASAHRVDSLLALRQLHLVALLFVAANEFRTPAQLRRALWWFFAVVALVSVYAMLQTLLCVTSIEAPAWVGRLLKVKYPACRAPSLEPFRARGFFSIYMTLGGSLLVALSLLLADLALGARRAAAALQGALALVALLLTYVRNAWVGLAVALAVVVALSRRWLVLAAAAAAVAVLAAVPGPARGKLASIFDPTSPSVSERLHFWDAGRRMIADAPVLGHGPGTVKFEYPRYKPPAARRTGTSHLHNNLVQVAAERGLLGLAAWLAVWAAFFVRAGRIYAALPRGRLEDRALVAGSLAAVAGFLVAGLFEYNFGDSEVIALVWVVAAFPFVVERAEASGRVERRGGMG